jgi:hypothetical protein
MTIFLKDFKMANRPIKFFICIGGNVQQNNSYENIKTDEKLVIKTKRQSYGKMMLLVSRYRLNAVEDWIEANEKEISEWHTSKLNRKINVDLNE